MYLKHGVTLFALTLIAGAAVAGDSELSAKRSAYNVAECARYCAAHEKFEERYTKNPGKIENWLEKIGMGLMLAPSLGVLTAWQGMYNPENNSGIAFLFDHQWKIICLGASSVAISVAIESYKRMKHLGKPPVGFDLYQEDRRREASQ